MPGIIHKLDGWTAQDPPKDIELEQLTELRDLLIELKAVYDRLLKIYRTVELKIGGF